jgi:hypothetical protein
MNKSALLANTYAISEVIGASLLVLIAVASATFIYFQMFPVPIPALEPNVQLMGYVTDNGEVIIEHMGGEILNSYEVHIDGEKVYKNPDGEYLEIGDIIPSSFIPMLCNESDKLHLTVYSLIEDGNNVVVFDGMLFGPEEEEAFPLPPLFHPMLISSLRTNSNDEDLICFTYNVTSSLNVSTYVFNWKVDGDSISDINVPFDTENNVTCKDYSGNGLNGTLSNTFWSNNGVIGGSCYFDGDGDYIDFDEPPIFNNISNIDFSISMWINNTLLIDNAVMLMVCEDQNNFVKIFTQYNQLHVGIYCNGVKYSVRTVNLSIDTWYHIAAVWYSDDKTILVYCNGIEYDMPGYRQFALGSHPNSLELGHGTASSNFWMGYMDQLVIYKKALSQEQIYQLYLSEKEGDISSRVIVSEETSLGDIWQVEITPNDGTQDDTTVTSNNLQIGSYGGGG